MPRALRKLSVKEKAIRNKKQREYYHAHKETVMAARRVIAKGHHTPIHLHAAAKRVVAAINLQLRDDPSLTDLIITAHVLAKAVLGS